jgi:FkbM family methyltransferase
LPEAFATLAQRLAGIRGLAMNNIALGSVREERELLVSRFDEASSFLELGPVLENRVYGIDFSIDRRIPVAVEALADYVTARDIRKIDLLKLDVQGFELEVLRGGASILDRVDWIYTEVQFLELYRGGPLAADVAAFLEAAGFDLVRRTSLRYDDAGKLMECDLVFRRRRR